MYERFKPVALIGAGEFAEMLLKGILRHAVLDAGEVVATVRRQERAAELQQRYGIRVEFDNAKAATYSQTIILCVRPQQIAETAACLNSTDLKDKCLISVVAGVPVDKLRELFGSKTIIRANPNPQVEIGFGMTALAYVRGLDEQARSWIELIFTCLGEIVHVDESVLNAFSALSGIVHVLYFFDCLVEAGIYLGLSEKIAKKVVHKSIMGSMMLLDREDVDPNQLIRKAATPGGVGAEKLFALEKRAFRAAIVEAMGSARDKAASLAKLSVPKLSVSDLKKG